MLNLAELLQGVLDSLETDIAPNVSDAGAKAQLYACLDVLGNLAAKMDWKIQILSDECEGIRTAVTRTKERIATSSGNHEELAGVMASIDALVSADVDEQPDEPVDWVARKQRCAAVFEELVRVVGESTEPETEDDQGLYDDLRAYIHEHLVSQMIRDALYLKPMRLSEISKA